MKVCFCGLGSIGKRHLKNLLIIGKESGVDFEIHAFRKTERILEEELTNIVFRQILREDELDHDYDFVFVTNPTALHYDTIRMMEDKTRHMFIEKPIFEDIDYDISDFCLNGNGVFYVAGPLRYSRVIQTLKEILPHERVYCVRAICSSYLPDWRPDTDYRLSYSARKSLGGGVVIDLIHEWDYLVGLFGFPKRICTISGKYSSLEIDSEDAAVYIAEYEDKVIELHLDYFGRMPRREIEIFTENGTITGDLINQTVTFPDGRKQILFNEGKNDIYLREMRFFIDHILNEQDFNNLNDCYSILKIALGKALI